MKTAEYIGTKMINAIEMNRLEYNTLRGWDVPDDENPDDPGMLVEYPDSPSNNVEGFDGYVSWSPLDVFNNAYRLVTGMNFGLAIEAMKKGCKVARVGWNGKDMFAYMVPANQYPAQTNAIKTVFPDLVPYRAYMALKTAQNDVSTWAPSGSDCLADDWLIVE